MEKAILIGMTFGLQRRREAEESLEELKELTLSAGGEVVLTLLQHRDRPDSKYLLGEGKVDEVAALLETLSPEVVIFDNRLSPSQQRNLERRWNVKVVDRTQLILDIFAQRAKSREGKLQVELAQLLFLLPRLTGKGTSLSRLGGGIGTRGPGEKKLEYERRSLRDQIVRIKNELKELSLRRSRTRENRRKSPLPVVCLAGYTSAGKSSLFNLLTREGALVSSRLFSTLDPLTRLVTLPSGLPFLLSDTVGFIRNLPIELVEAFKSTLDEILCADLILHVVDYSSPQAKEQAESVRSILAEISAGQVPLLQVNNKIDLIDSGSSLLEKNCGERPEEVFLSVKEKLGVEDLLRSLDRMLFGNFKLYRFTLEHSKENILSSVEKKGFIVRKTAVPQGWAVEVYLKYEDMLQFFPKFTGKGD
ncbi:MAG TPA: GTPase HflX [Candidatus Aminicenantes bacterium]|nr:GTPase HflX [Candidatus Aminicenantes bacterium]HPB55125.1 GTPase HflX [Candidatus Aminicenantes bacterium]HPS99107.1 GTPase HflX [Candidatus Aminicenantes bacterium]